jgi:hypothetical protein
MKKIFIALLAIATFFTACTSETFVTSLSVSQTAVSDSIELNATKALTVSMTNTSENTGSVSWELTEKTALTGTYSLKVDQSAKSNTGSLELAANASASFELTFAPTAAGSGVYELTLKNEEGLELSKVTFTVTAYETVVVVNPPVTYPLFTVEKDTVYGSTPAGQDLDLYFKLTNVSGGDLNMKWIRLNETVNSGIDIAICDWANCVALPTTSASGTITNNQVVDMKFQVVPDANASGSKGIDLMLFVVGDSANTVKTVHLNVAVR